MQKREYKILLTGGHAHATAYALIKQIKKTLSKAEVYWIGPKSLIEGNVVPGVEDKVFESLGVKVFNVNAGRVQMKFTRHTIPALFKIPLGFFQSLILVGKLRPSVTVSFGGFVGLPVVVVSWLFGIPVIIHEQTTVAGRGNIYAAKFAKKVVISRNSSRKYFPADKTVLIGNPIDNAKLSFERKNRISSVPMLLITGGHSGSSALNSAMIKVLPVLLKTYYVIHQTGEINYPECLNFKERLPKVIIKNYEIYPNIDPRIWPTILNKVDILVSRAGANTVSEVVALKIPSLLVPIPHTYLDEQSKNADFAVEFGIAKKMEQTDMTPDNLIKEITYLRNNWQKIVDSVKNKKSPDLQASENFAKLIVDEEEKRFQENISPA